MPGLFLTRADARELVLTAQENLVAGGPAEQLEQIIQTSFKQGIQRVLVDLSGVLRCDSAGIRALVRGHTSAERLGRQFTLVAPNSQLKEELRLSRLDQVFTVCDSVSMARSTSIRWPRIFTIAAVALVGGLLVLIGYLWPDTPTAAGPTGIPGIDASDGAFLWHSPLLELAKLVVAAVIGMLVTLVQRHYRVDRSNNPTLEQAQVLLCVSGALIMIIIGSSLPRAFGIAGAASIIRFRTPVEDPKDVTILFLLMGLGMSSGLGAWAVAGLGTAFLCIALVALDHMSSQKARVMSVEIQAGGREFPTTHVEGVFARNQIVWEPREISQSGDVTVKYHTWLDPRTSLEDLSSQLMSEGAGVQSVAWEHPKRER